MPGKMLKAMRESRVVLCVADWLERWVPITCWARDCLKAVTYRQFFLPFCSFRFA